VTDMAGRFRQGNQRAVESLGYSREELLGMSVADIEVDLVDGQHVEKHWSRLGEGKRVVFHGRHRRKDGSLFPVEVHLIQVELGGEKAIYGVARDISERQQAEDAIRRALAEAEEARERVEVLLESISDGLLFTDQHHAVVLMSPTAEALLEQRWDESFRQPVDQILAGTLLPEQLQEIVSGRRDKGAVEWALPGRGVNEQRIFQGKSSVVKGRSGMAIGVITLLRDVTRERELERIKTEFISTAAHELRTPLTAVMGFSELLLHTPSLDEENRNECLAIIHQKTEHLANLVDDLLDISRIEAGQLLQLHRVPCELKVLLQQFARSFDIICSRHRFALDCTEQEVRLLVDAGKLSQVLDNLFSNAIKFSPPGSLIRLSCHVSETQIQVTVSDEGIGMTPSQVERVFDKFYRADASETAKRGLGLGMAIVKNIIEAHEGRIWVESALGQGTQVHFTLPVLQEEPPDVSPS